MKAYMLGVIWGAFSFFNVLAAVQSVTPKIESAPHHNVKPWSVEFVGLTEQVKNRENDLIGTYSKLDTSILYSANSKSDFRFFSALTYEDFAEGEDSFTWELVEFMYRRKSILNESDHGVYLEAEFKNYYVMDEELRDHRWRFDGAFIPQLIVKKKMTSQLTFEFKGRRHFPYRNSSKMSALRSENRLYFTQIFVPKWRWFVTNEFKYRHKEFGGRHFSFREMKMMPKKQDLLIMRPSIMYLFNNRLLGEIFTETTLMKSQDHSFIAKEWNDQWVLGMGLYLAAW